jgi:predicted ATPase
VQIDRLAWPGFELNDGNRAAVADICRTLDGLPLAIELAAARVRALSPEQIAYRLADKFELLALGDRTAPPRQQTLRATVEWSNELLNPAERLLLSRLSVFHGWNLDMAERVCADSQLSPCQVLDYLRALIDKSLVNLDGELNGDARYRLLDTVRELAAEHAVAAEETSGLRARIGTACSASPRRLLRSPLFAASRAGLSGSRCSIGCARTGRTLTSRSRAACSAAMPRKGCDSFMR